MLLTLYPSGTVWMDGGHTFDLESVVLGTFVTERYKVQIEVESM